MKMGNHQPSRARDIMFMYKLLGSVSGSGTASGFLFASLTYRFRSSTVKLQN